MPVPNTFANATTSIPLSQLDANFATAITLGNTAIQLGNTVTTLNNMTMANVTITTSTVSGGTANGVAYLDANKALTTGTALVFDGANLGLGVTPSAWAGVDLPAIDIGQYTAIFNSSANKAGGVASNSYYNGSSWKYKTTAEASLYVQDFGTHAWLIAPSGTAGNTITWTTAMTLDASGKLKLGGYNYDGRRLAIEAPSNGQALAIYTNGGGASAILVSTNNLAIGANAAATIMLIEKESVTSRSINAAGTVNASGADYAEYENNNGLTVAKGQIVGFKADGSLTLTYAQAVRFGVKSTNPSYVGGDTWGGADRIGERPEKPADSAEQEVKDQYEADLAAFEERLEAARQQVDRIAYSGKVPCNVMGATAGDYIIAVEAADGSIDGQPVADPDFAQYKRCVGRVNRILDDGRAEVAVIVH